jgi:hypothetical protein
MAAAKQNGSSKNTKQKTVTEDLFDALNPNTMLNNAQRVLSSAVNVLEEEIAAGILAAKKIEKKVINVDDVRSNNENLANRLRKDAHEVVDLFIDSLIAVTNQLKHLSNNINDTSDALKKATSSSTKPKADTTIAVLQPDEPIKPGATIILRMQLSNDESTDAVRIALKKNDLIGASNQKILSKQIQIKPPVVTLKPGEEKEIAIQVKVPAACKTGHYTALLVDELNPKIKAVLNIEVL